MELNFEKTKLKNGITVYYSNNDSGLMTIMFNNYLDATKAPIKGITHFLEHVICNSANKFLDDANYYESVARFRGNVTTGVDRISVFGNLLPEETEDFFKYMKGILFEPNITEELLESEKRRVISEIKQFKCNKKYERRQKIDKTIFQEGSIILFDLLGEEKDILSITKEKLEEYHKNTINPSNMVVFMVGTLPEDMMDILENNFGKYEEGQKNSPNKTKNNLFTEKKELFLDSDEITRTNINLTFPFPNGVDPNSLKASILSDIISGRLNKKLSIELGLTYSVSVRYTRTVSSGDLLISTEVNNEDIEKTKNAIFEEITKILNEGVTEKEFNRRLMHFKFHIIKTYSTTDSQVTMLSDLHETGRFFPDLISNLDKLTIEDLKVIAKQYLTDDQEKGLYVFFQISPKVNVA